MKLKGFIFDLDGTLINSLPIVRTSLSNTLLKFTGREYSANELSSLFGPSEDGIFKKLFPDSWQESLQFYLDEYNRLHVDSPDPFPGIIDALTHLQERNIKLALVSGKGAGSMEISLRHSGIKRFFEVIITGSEHQASKPQHIVQILKHWNFKPEETAYVGDIAYDVWAAKEAGVWSISALWAETAQVQKVLAMNPAFAFENVESFIDWIRKTI
ncbi:haloacid dehalogenase superfamily enzyme, subfamily IA [Desulfosporosinus orientis DSM 765]|uniref:Haloacid dehalogenase superfamily enzyme, subfamily IA n=1 Tax=Desulfosporosinus orientis (strain ATCC 19365 / DSM 765 / NCIMB 8382 / VKM B-1628 / Singapore I) TaxID=768706 RepID=G7WAC3_DESOD|nr:HAD family hydrolase [Desulfosporosinus orientis]AET66472.1 haloacid dehalogenase superfamily enzyme, subfamily IA [Desulfosporosinus orientis DSM 765]